MRPWMRMPRRERKSYTEHGRGVPRPSSRAATAPRMTAAQPETISPILASPGYERLGVGNQLAYSFVEARVHRAAGRAHVATTTKMCGDSGSVVGGSRADAH